MTDFIIRWVDDLGFMLIIKDEAGEEVYRGEYKNSAEAALESASNWKDF